VLIASGHKNSRQAFLHIEDTARNGKPPERVLNIKTCSMGEMKDWPVLQAADMLAYGEYQKHKARQHDIDVLAAWLSVF